ncbi:MAG: PLP-dependent aminotransferase family protein [Ignisphaera sp.]|nr:PLP-dependent aminotransferase family protein [Ignisphaera sp.]MDW8085585.1 PLP-dependent aminotransferase family protein [Ignisphaera sp.]
MISYKRYMSKDGDYVASIVAKYSLKFLEDRSIISFAGGLPDPATFPVDDLKRIAVEVIEKHGCDALQYMPSRGVSTYVRELVDFLYRARGIRVDADNVIVTTGSQQAIDIIARMYVDEGVYIAVEEPTYVAALNAFRARKPRFIGVPIDDFGMRTDALEDKLRRLRSEANRINLLYTVPTAQNPSGVTLSVDRRKHLIELANEFDFLIVEDDAYGLMIFDEGASPPPLFCMDRSGRVIYVGSLSKVLTPGMRLGHIVAPREVIESLEPFKQIADLHTPSITQHIAAVALRERIIERSMPRIRSVYRMKRDAMLRAIQEHIVETAWWTRPIGGMFIWIKLNTRVDTERLLPKAYSRGVIYVPGRGFYHNEDGFDTMRLNFTYPSIDQIEEGIERLSRVIMEELCR